MVRGRCLSWLGLLGPVSRSSKNASLITRAASPRAHMVTSPHENSLSLGPYSETSAPSKSSFPVFSPLVNAYSRLSSWRAALGLPNPGTVENLQKEVKSEFFYRLQVGSGCLTGWYSNAFDQLHLRWRASGPYEGTVDGSSFPSYPFVPIGLAIRTPELLIRRVVRESQGRSRMACLILFTINAAPKGYSSR